MPLDLWGVKVNFLFDNNKESPSNLQICYCMEPILKIKFDGDLEHQNLRKPIY